MAIITALGAELAWLARLLIAAVFVISGAAKLSHRNRFQDTLAALELVPRGAVRRIAQSLPVLEIALGVWVVTGWQPVLAGGAVACLLLAFLAGLASYRWRGGKEIACGCFADFEHKTPTAALIRRNILLLATLPLLLISEPAPAAHDATGWLLAATVVLGVFLGWSLARGLARTRALLAAELLLDGK